MCRHFSESQSGLRLIVKFDPGVDRVVDGPSSGEEKVKKAGSDDCKLSKQGRDDNDNENGPFCGVTLDSLSFGEGVQGRRPVVELVGGDVHEVKGQELGRKVNRRKGARVVTKRRKDIVDPLDLRRDAGEDGVLGIEGRPVPPVDADGVPDQQRGVNEVKAPDES